MFGSILILAELAGEYYDTYKCASVADAQEWIIEIQRSNYIRDILESPAAQKQLLEWARLTNRL